MHAPSPSATGLQGFTADVAGHRIEVIPGGTRRMERLHALISGAIHNVDLIMYIFDNDAAGRSILAALTTAARRGVRVRAVIDSFGSSNTPDAFFDPLRSAGGIVTFFSRRWRSSYLVRNHQKLLLIDGNIAMTGGFNIADGYLGQAGPDDWCDLGFVLKGPVVERMAQWFEAIHAYAVNDDGKLLVLRRLIRDWPVDDAPVGWLLGGPTQRLAPWARAVRFDLKNVQRLDMAMAYFSPGQGMLRQLGRVARHGTARFVTAGKSDNGATIGASRLLYGYLLRKRATIWEYRQERLHMKLIVIDDVSYIGTANFDMRSLFINVEAMIRIENADFASRMRALINQLEPGCEIVTRARLKQHGGWLNRLRWTLSWLVVGFADYTVTRRLNFGLNDGDPDVDED